MTAPGPAHDFLRVFEEEPLPEPAERLDEGDGPPIPDTTDVTDDSVRNYRALAGINTADGYGVTGLMSVLPFSNRCYGTVPTGTVFLLPGIRQEYGPPWDGTDPSINCAAREPMHNGPGSIALHKQMCGMLGEIPHTFIGFGAVYPVERPQNIGYNSTTCNISWFGTRTLPPEWQSLVRSTLLTYLA
ncbi:hypothetical protein ACIQMJ_27040 [Actinosynnema sp. NPDC091369]